MAEALARNLHSGLLEPYSAGIEPKSIDRRALKVMSEVGVDISSQHPKHIDELSDVEFDVVITVCDDAYEKCPYLPARAKLMHIPFPDPPRLAEKATSEEEALEHYRRVRDGMKALVQRLPSILRNYGLCRVSPDEEGGDEHP